jgi:surface polysaccharide O-acyltransferase-like enzyme
MSRKIMELEVVRGISFIAIIMQHVLACFLYRPDLSVATALTSWSLLTLSRFGVPVFVFLTGFVLMVTYRDQKIDYLHFLKKRGKLILIPYILWSLFYTFYTGIISGKPFVLDLNIIKSFLLSLLLGDAMYHLWYLVMIIQFYLLFPAFKKLIEKFGHEKFWKFFLLATFCYQTIALWLYHSIIPNIMNHTSNGFIQQIILNRDKNFLFWMFYFILGGVIAMNLEQCRLLIKKYFFVILGIFILGFFGVLYETLKGFSINASGGFMLSYNLTSPTALHMLPFLTASVILLFALSFVLYAKLQKLSDFLITAGKLSFGGYLIHPIFVTLFYELVARYLVGIPLLIQFITALLLTVATTLLGILLYHRSKLAIGKISIGA